jgi:hypothetical protein
MSDKLYEFCFLVNTRPYAVYGWDLAEENFRFLNGVDHDYFSYLAKVHRNHLEGDDRQRAAIALRIAFHHAVETQLTLLLAIAQAPNCLFAWIPKCNTGDLRALVELTTKGPGTIFNLLGVDELSWRALARFLFSKIECVEEEQRSLIEAYGKLWSRLAHEYLSPKNQDEYNSLKHGFRNRAGGFTLAYGAEKKPGEAAAPEDMRVLGGSKFGSTFYVPEPLEGSPEGKKSRLIYMRPHSLNWNPKSMSEGLEVVAHSIEITIALLRVHLGGAPGAQISVPENLEDLAAAWKDSPVVAAQVLTSLFATGSCLQSRPMTSLLISVDEH